MWPLLNPRNIKVDYEIAIHQALCTIFPQNNKIVGFFHLNNELEPILE